MPTTKTTPAKKPAVKASKPAVKKETTKAVAPVAKVESKKIVYSHSNLKVSPRKLRLLANEIKKIAPVEAVTRLQFTNTNAARLFRSCLKTAIANAKAAGINQDNLSFSEVMVNEGQKIKRMDKSHGSRFARGIITKRHSRLNITLSGTIQS